MKYIEKSRKMLEGWVKYSLKDLYICPDRPDLVCCGAGYNGWGMQTHQKALAAFTVAAVKMDVDESDMGVTKTELLDYCLKMLRYMLETHIEGSYECVEGDKWGHTWISVLGTERVMHAVESLKEYMTESDLRLLEKVFISEADWLLDCYDIKANPIASTGENKPESNIWNGAFLHRVAMMYPDCNIHPKLYSFIFNNYSTNSNNVNEVQDFISATSLYEYINYPTCAKYYLNQYTNIGLHTRKRFDKLFTNTDILQMESLRNLTDKYVAEYIKG